MALSGIMLRMQGTTAAAVALCQPDLRRKKHDHEEGSISSNVKKNKAPCWLRARPGTSRTSFLLRANCKVPAKNCRNLAIFSFPILIKTRFIQYLAKCFTRDALS